MQKEQKRNTMEQHSPHRVRQVERKPDSERKLDAESKADGCKKRNFSEIPTEARLRYIDEISEDVAMKTGIRLPIVRRIISCEIGLMDEWDDEEQLDKPLIVMAKHISARTGLYLTTVLTVMNTEEEIISLIDGGCDCADHDSFGCDFAESDFAESDCSGCNGADEDELDGESAGDCLISMSEMVKILYQKTGICPKIIDLIIQLEDEVFEKRGIMSVYCCGED